MRTKIRRRYARLHMLAKESRTAQCWSLSSLLGGKVCGSSCFNAGNRELKDTRDASDQMMTMANPRRKERQGRFREQLTSSCMRVQQRKMERTWNGRRQRSQESRSQSSQQLDFRDLAGAIGVMLQLHQAQIGLAGSLIGN